MDPPTDWTRILFLLAFVLIGLFRWIANTMAERRAANQSDQTELEEDYQDWQPPASSPLPPPVPAEAGPPPPRLPDQLREFFESVAPAAVPEPAAPQPAPTPPSAQLSKAERDALETIRSGSATPMKATRSTRSTAPALDELRVLLSSPGSLKQAFLLKEILDEPKSLKSPGSLGSF